MDEPTRITAEDLAETLTPLDGSVRAMFGGYSVYIDGKVVGMVCDGRVFAKPAVPADTFEGWAEPAPAYPGAKDSWRLPADALRDDPERVIDTFAAIAAALPVRAPRKR